MRAYRRATGFTIWATSRSSAAQHRRTTCWTGCTGCRWSTGGSAGGRHRFAAVKDYDEIAVKDPDALPHGKRKIVLLHYAMRVWNRSHHGSWHLYGHSHGSLPDDPNSLSFDVGVDCWGYAPISYQEVKSVMSGKTFAPIDHHGKPGD